MTLKFSSHPASNCPSLNWSPLSLDCLFFSLHLWRSKWRWQCIASYVEWLLQEKYFASRKNSYWKWPHLCPIAHFITFRMQGYVHCLNVPRAIRAMQLIILDWENKITPSWMSHFQEWAQNSYSPHLCFQQQFYFTTQWFLPK